MGEGSRVLHDWYSWCVSVHDWRGCFEEGSAPIEGEVGVLLP